MKKLVIKGLLLSTAVCLPLWIYVFFWPSYVLHEESSSWTFTTDVINGNVRLPETEVLIMGDSRTMAGVVPQLISSQAVSIALGGITPVEIYYSLKTYLQNNPPPEMIILGIAPVHFENRGSFRERTLKFNFLDYGMFSELVSERFSSKQLELKDIVLYGLHRVRFPLLYIPELQKAVLKPRNRMNQMAYISRIENKGYVARGTAQSVADAALHEEAYKREFTVTSENRLYFQRTLKLVKEQNVRLVYVTLPFNRATRELVTSQYQSGYRDYIESAFEGYPGYKYNADLMVYPDSCFGDSSHLNIQGAERFSHYIKKVYVSSEKMRTEETSYTTIL